MISIMRALYRGLGLALLVLLCSCGQFGGPRDVGERDLTKPGKPSSKQPKEPVTIVDTGKLGAICKTIVDEKKPDQPLPNLGELKDRFLQAHNDIRSRYSLKPLVWDDQIAAYAQRWADHLKNTNKCEMKHRSDADKTKEKKYGENLGVVWIPAPIAAGTFISSPELVVWAWSIECKDYSYADASCTPNEQCGHFTQVVWADSIRVGCGIAVCDGTKSFKGQRAEVWVCNYDPAGNISMNGTPLKPF